MESDGGTSPTQTAADVLSQNSEEQIALVQSEKGITEESGEVKMMTSQDERILTKLMEDQSSVLILNNNVKCMAITHLNNHNYVASFQVNMTSPHSNH